MKKQVYEKIISKKEFSDLPKNDVEMIYSVFDKKDLIEEEKIKNTRDLLRKVYFAFGSLKLLNPEILKKKTVEEILKKHISTKERFIFYEKLYGRLLKDFKGKFFSIIDLGAGINGLSYGFLKHYSPGGPGYIGFEAVGQLVDLMNDFFTGKYENKAIAVRGSLFDLEDVKEFVELKARPRIVFLFKTIDSLEMVERNYSKKLLKEIVPLVEKVVVSFATKSLVSKRNFRVRRY